MLRAYPWRCGGPVRKTAFLLVLCLLLFACSGPKTKPVRTTRAKGVYHVVKSGETLASISRAYHIGMQELAEFNNIENPNLIGVNRVIFIPEADQVIDDVMALTSARKPDPLKPAAKEESRPKAAAVEKKAAPVLPAVEEATGLPAIPARPGNATIKIKPRRDVVRLPADGETRAGTGESPDPGDVPQKTVVREVEPVQKPVVKGGQAEQRKGPPTQSAESAPVHQAEPTAGKPETEALRFDRKRFIWPVRGKVLSRFGIQPNGMYYNGITIAAKENQPVVAAADGTIIFSGPLKDYGETVIMKHDDGYATVYTRLGERRAKLDDHLKKGSQIGMTAGKRSESQVVFEIRYKNKARNPMFFLP